MPIKQLRSSLALIFVILFLPPLRSAEAAPSGATPIRVGMILPLSGPFATFGEAIKIGFEMGLSTVPIHNIKLFYEDSAYDTKQALSAFNKLIAVDRVQIAVVMGSPMTAALLPLANTKKIPFFAWTPSKRATEGHTDILRLMSAADRQGSAIAKEMERRNYSRVALISSNNEYSQTVKDGLVQSSPPDRLVFQQEVEPSETDFRTLIAKIRLKNPDAIALCINTPQIASFSNQARSLGLKIPIFGCHMMSSQEILKQAGPALEGAWFIEGASYHQFQSEFEKKDSDTSGIWMAAASYDLAKMLGKFSAENIDPGTYVTRALDICLERSGFEKNCVKEENGVKYFDVPLNVTNIRDSKFIRDYQ